jgi:hypothetical protein
MTMNKLIVATTVTGLALAGLSSTVSADQRDRENLFKCEHNINQALGADTDTRLYGIQHRRGGDKLRLKVYPAGGASQVVNCLIDREGAITLQTADGVALTTPAFDGVERVSLTE